MRIVDALFPSSCLACGRPIEAPALLLLCVPCRGGAALIDPRRSCSGCARQLAPGRAEGAGAASWARCLDCLAEPPPFDRLLVTWRYEPPIDAVVRALKFRRQEFLAAHLADAVCDREGIGLHGPWDEIVPVPLVLRRRLTRGFNQAERIAQRLGERLALPVTTPLRRQGWGKGPQSRQGRLARLTRSASELTVDAPERLVGKSLLLVDDVTTTGATLRACAAALAAAGATRVTAFALAATPRLRPGRLS